MQKITALITGVLPFLFVVILGGCSNDSDHAIAPPPAEPDNRITLSVAAPDFAGYDQQSSFTVTLSEPLDRDLTIGVASSDPSKAVVPDYVVLKAHETSVSGTVTPVANGKATLFIFCADTDINIIKPYDNMLVTHPQPAVNGEIVVADFSVDYTNEVDRTMPAQPANNYWICPIVMESSSRNSGDHKPGWRSACVWYHTMNWVGVVASYGKATIDNFGCPVVGKIEHKILYMSMLDKGVIIDNSLSWVENVDRDPAMMGKDGAWGFQCSPYIYSYQYKDNAGKKGYLVTRLAYKDEEKGIPFGFYRAWIEVDVRKDGSILFEKAALCCNNRAFKTGQEKN